MKTKLESIMETLLSEGQEAAAPLMHKYIIETCLEINDSIIKEDNEDIDSEANQEFVDTTTEITSTPVLLTVAYKDPEGDCSYDAAILSALGREDMDGSSFAEGIRSLVFQYDDMSSADAASDILEDRDEDSALPEELFTDVVELDFSEPEETTETTVEESDDSLPGEESPLSDTTPEGITEDETTETTVEDFSDIFTDPNESTEDKVNDLASEIEDLKRQIAEMSTDDSIEESFSYEPVKTVKNTDGTDSSGKKVPQNDDSTIPGNTETVEQRLEHAGPIEIHSTNHSGYARETAPAVKTIDVSARNQRKTATETMEKVTKEGDASALLNKSFPAENDASIIDGKK